MSNLVKQGQIVPPVRRQPDDFWLPREPEERIDLRKYALILLKRKWSILAVALTVTAGFAIHTFSQTPLYRSTAQIQINPDVPMSALPFKDPFSDSWVTEAYMRTQHNILQSQNMAIRVVRRLSLGEDPAFNTTPRGLLDSVKQLAALVFAPGSAAPPPGSGQEAAEPPVSELALAQRLRGGLRISPVQGTRLINISYSSHDPQLAARVVNAMAQEAVSYYFETQSDATSRATGHLQRQLEDMQKQVERSEEKLLQYARANNLFNLDEGKNLVQTRLQLLTEELTRTEAELIARSIQSEVIQNATPENFPQILKNETIVTLEGRLYELQQKLGSLSTQYGPEWPEVVQIQEEISRVDVQLREARGQAILQAKIDHEGLLESKRKLLAALEEQQDQSENLSARSIQYNILEREAETNKQIYEALLQRVKEAGVTTGLKSSNILIVDSGTAARRPYAPDANRSLMMGLALGMMFGVGLAFVLEHLDNTVKTPDDVEERLGLGCLGLVPQLDGARIVGEEEQKASGLAGALVKRSARKRSVGLGETYRSIRTSILLSHSGQPPQTVLVTSSLPGEGKTTTVSNLGIVLAQTGERTLLVDLDMRKPRLAAEFKLRRGVGMSEYLSGNSDLSAIIRQTAVPNLFVISAGAMPPNPAELVGSARLLDGLGLMREYFRHIVIDSPPVLTVTDARIIATSVDGVVLVIHGGETSREAARKAAAQVEGVGGKILGTVINKLDLKKTGYGYYESYYYQYYYESSYGAEA